MSAAIVSSVVNAFSSDNTASQASSSAANTAASSERVGLAQVGLGQDQLAYAKERNTANDAVASKVVDAQLKSQETQDAQAKDYADYNKNTFRPLEQSIVNDANTYDTPEREDAAAAKAGAGVTANFGLQRDSAARRAWALGINPNSGNYAAMDTTIGNNEAAATADAENSARSNTQTVGRAMKMDAASLGRNLPGNQATSAGLAINAGNSAVGNQNNTSNTNLNSLASANGFYNGATNSFNSAGNAFNNVHQNANTATNNAMSGAGSAAGLALKYWNTPAATPAGQGGGANAAGGLQF